MSWSGCFSISVVLSETACVLSHAVIFSLLLQGIELDVDKLSLAHQAASASGVAHLLTFVESNIFDADLSAATVLITYLFPAGIQRLAATLRQRVGRGTRILSPAFQ